MILCYLISSFSYPIISQRNFMTKFFFHMEWKRVFLQFKKTICIVCDILKVCIAAEPTSSTNDSLKVSDSGIHHAPHIYLKECPLSSTLICSTQWLILLQHSSGTLSLGSEHLVCDLSSFSTKQGTLCIIDSAAAKYSVCCSIHFFFLSWNFNGKLHYN